MTAPTDERAALHLKVRGVALWIKTLRGEAPVVVDSAFETLLLASDALSAQPVGAVQPMTPNDVHQTEGESGAAQRPAIEGLLPCPFCGGPVDKFDDDLSDDGVVLECRWCSASRSSTRESAVEGWNRRTPAASVNSASDRSDDFDHAHPDSWKYEAKSEVGGAVQPPPSSPEPRWCEFARQLIERGGPMVRAAYNDIPGPSCVDMGSWMQDAMRTMRALAAPPSSTPEPLTDERAAIATDLRAEFEAWFMDYCGTGPQDAVFDQPSYHWLDRREDGEYEETRVRDAWQGWAGHAARCALAETQRSSHTG